VLVECSEGANETHKQFDKKKMEKKLKKMKKMKKNIMKGSTKNEGLKLCWWKC